MNHKLTFLYLFHFVIFISFISCNSYNKKSTELISIDIQSALKNTRELKLSEIAKDIELIKLESKGESYFSDIKQIYVGEKYIVILDHRSDGKHLFIFYKDGKFHTLLNKTGKGPGEYVNIWSFAVSPDESRFVIGDQPSQKIIVYNMDGKFINETVLKNAGYFSGIDRLTFLNDNKLLVNLFLTPSKGEVFNSIIVFDKKLELITKLLPKPEFDPKDINMGFTYLDVIDDQASLWESAYDTIFYIDKNLISTSKYLVDISNLNTKIIWSFFINTPRHLFMTGFPSNSDGNKMHFIGFDKKLNEEFNLNNKLDSKIADLDQGIINDLNGLSPFIPYIYQNNLDAMIFPINIDDITPSNIEDIKNAQVKFSKKRRELLFMLEESSVEDNPILMIVYLK